MFALQAQGAGRQALAALLSHQQRCFSALLRCRLEAASVPEKLAVTNGGNSKQRLMLRNAAVQLQDCYGNAAAGGGVQVGGWGAA